MEDQKRYEKVFRKFKKSELSDVACQLDLEIDPKLATRTKKEIVSVLVEKCLLEKISSSRLLKIELKYLSDRPNTVTWKAYRLEYTSSLPQTLAVSDPTVFMKRFQLYLGDVWNCEMVQSLISCGYWLCLRFNSSSSSSYTCCVLRYPSSPFLFLSGFHKVHLSPVLEALSLTMDCVGCTELGLSGRNLESLVEMVHNQHSQGPRTAYRLNQVDPNPLLVARRQHPKVGTEPCEVEEENTAKRCKSVAVETFGTNPLPTIEKFTFNLKTVVPRATEDTDDVFCCRLKLVGSSVLEGTKAAISEDCFTFPIPDIIKKIPTFASNSVTLESTGISGHS